MSRPSDRGKTFTFEIKTLTPSLNKWQRWHWLERKKFQDALCWEIKIAAYPLNIPDSISDYRKVHIISYRKSLLDDDNFVGGLKPLLDSLVDLRFIYDDSDAYLDRISSQALVHKRAEEKTLISIILS